MHVRFQVTRCACTVSGDEVCSKISGDKRCACKVSGDQVYRV